MRGADLNDQQQSTRPRLSCGVRGLLYAMNIPNAVTIPCTPSSGCNPFRVREMRDMELLPAIALRYGSV